MTVHQQSGRDRWFFCKTPRPMATKRLFCFPFAGGGASVFHGWAEAIGDDVEVLALQLPGRERRYNEAPEIDIEQLVRDIAAALATWHDKPYALFGYSLGALLAFEVCRELRRDGSGLPDILQLAAMGAAQLPPPHPPISGLPDSEFVEQVDHYFQPRNEAWQNLELREILLPILKADIALYESYFYRDEPPLPCPIEVFAGDSDRATSIDSTRQWSQQTVAAFMHHVLPGGHFFIENALPELQRLVAAALARGA